MLVGRGVTSWLSGCMSSSVTIGNNVKGLESLCKALWSKPTVIGGVSKAESEALEVEE
jgi:hypothetical protein